MDQILNFFRFERFIDSILLSSKGFSILSFLYQSKSHNIVKHLIQEAIEMRQCFKRFKMEIMAKISHLFSSYAQ